jgi:hypothetical protein
MQVQRQVKATLVTRHSSNDRELSNRGAADLQSYSPSLMPQGD